MAANSGTSAAGSGFNQQSGGYYITVGDVRDNALTFTDGTGSGGATTQGAVAAFAWDGLGLGGSSTLLATGKLIKDMGRHVYSAGRAFRKFQTVATTASLSTGGVTGQAASSTNAGYLTFYLEVPKGGVGPNGATVPQIAKLS